MKFFVNNEEVDQATYDKLMAEAAKVEPKVVQDTPEVEVRRSKKVVRPKHQAAPAEVIAQKMAPVLKAPKVGTKTAQVIEVINRLGEVNKEVLLDEIVKMFGTTRANANAFIYNAKKKMGS